MWSEAHVRHVVALMGGMGVKLRREIDAEFGKSSPMSPAVPVYLPVTSMSFLFDAFLDKSGDLE
jgi:hypothetical protein